MLIRIFCIMAIFIFGLQGCVSTQVRGYSDRDYQNHKITKVVVRAPNVGFSFGEKIEDSFVATLKENGVSAESFLKMFPPTREWTDSEVSDELLRLGFQEIIYINLLGSSSGSQTIGYIHNGGGSVYDDNFSVQGTSTAVTALSRYTSARTTVYDVKTAKIIWVGDSDTEARGTLFLGDETQTDSISDETVLALKENGHL